MTMQQLVVIGDDLVVGSGDGSAPKLSTLAEASKLIDRKKPCLIALVPVPTAVIAASESTLDSACAARLPPGHGFTTEQLGPNLYQAFAIQDEMFAKLRALGRKVEVVPYSAAVRDFVSKRGQPAKTGIRRLTRVFLGDANKPSADGADPASAPECIVIDALQDDFLLTALRGREVLAVRRVRGGDPSVELRRTIASARMTNPRVICAEREVSVELQAQGYNSETVAATSALLGWSSLEAALPLRFLNANEIAQAHALRHRRAAYTTLAVSMVLFLLAAAAVAVCFSRANRAKNEMATLEGVKAERQAKLGELFFASYPTIARRESVKMDNELLDIMLALPPQVKVVSLEKDALLISAVIERQVDAAPFGRDDLRMVLATNPYFGKATIKEEFRGSTIRYLLSMPFEKGAAQ